METTLVTNHHPKYQNHKTVITESYLFFPFLMWKNYQGVFYDLIAGGVELRAGVRHGRASSV